MTDAQDRGWGPGWPTSRYDDMQRVEAGGIVVYMHKGIAELVGLLLEETVLRGYRLDANKDDWGYASRPITGSTTVPSNHSWGLAIDINASRNPYGDKLVTDMPKWMVELWKSYGFRWGGDYTGHPDAMHYEYMGTPEQARRDTERARRELGGGADEMAFADFKEGWKLYRDGKALGDGANADKVFGYNAAKYAASNPEPTAALPATEVPEHDHPHTHPHNHVYKGSTAQGAGAAVS